MRFEVPFSPVELENFVLKVGLSRRMTRGPGRPEGAPLKDFGGKLYGAVFQDELRDLLHRSLSLTSAPGAGLRLRLRLADTPELAELPWEFLYYPRLNRFLAQSRRTPLVRYLDLPDPPHPLAVEGPLRLLVMISSPAGYPALNVEQEWSLLMGALAEQRQDGRVIVERLAANMSILRRRLRRDQFHVFHFVGHGHYRPDWGDGVLVMEDRGGQPHEVTGEELGGLLNEYDPTRLAVLNACEGARSGAHDPFAGVAQSLIQQGLPAVVAMQFAITDDAAIVFARELYAAIADGYPLEAALAEARGAIRDEGNLTEWGTPVLYSRSPDGRLFDPTRRPRTSEVGRQTPEETGLQPEDDTDGRTQVDAEYRAWEESLDSPLEPDSEPRPLQVREEHPKTQEEAAGKTRQKADQKTRQADVRKAQQAAELPALEKRARAAGAAGDAARARDRYAALLPLREWLSGPEDPATLAAHASLAHWTGMAGDAAGARDRYAALLPLREGVSGPEDPATLAVRNGLARWTGMAGDAAGARDQYAALLPLRERVSGPENKATLSARTSLARWTGEAGDAAGARDQYAALLPLRERVSGRKDPATLAVRNSLAWWTGEAGDAAGARDRYAALLPLRERVSGRKDPATLAVRNGLARWTGEAGDAAGARDLYAELLPDLDRILGPAHPDTMTTRASLARWTVEARRGHGVK